MRGYIPPINDAEKFIAKRALELGKLASIRSSYFFSQFLDERGIELSIAQINKVQGINYRIYGGYDNSLRSILCVYDQVLPPPQNEEYEISIVNVDCKGAKQLTHRDFLGALMSLGIKRDISGDIIVKNGNSATIFLKKSATNMILSDLVEVGRYSAIVSQIENKIINDTSQNNEEKTITVSSLRLDVVVSAITNVSRSVANSLIKSKTVKVCQMPVENVHFNLQDDDVISIRGYGKYKVISIGGKSKKNKIYLKYQKLG